VEFFSFFSISYLKNYKLVLFVVDTQLQSLFFWFFIFVIGLFVKVLSVFNSIFQSQFVEYYFFQDLILLNFIFFLWLFVKVLLVFNLTFNPNLWYIIFSNLILIFLVLLLKWFFFSILLSIFFFNFYPHSFDFYFCFVSFSIIFFSFNFFLQYLIGWGMGFVVFSYIVLLV
jgi:hypothetical protein